jgi:hypothetical protein
MSFENEMKIGFVLAEKFEVVALPTLDNNMSSLKLRILEPFTNEPLNWIDQTSRKEVGLLTQAMRAANAKWAGIVNGDAAHIHVGFNEPRGQDYDHH